MQVKLEELAIVPAEEELSSLWVHPHSKRSALCIDVGDTEYLFIDGQAQAPVKSVHAFKWSPDGCSWACVVWDGGRNRVIRDGITLAEHESVGLQTLLWSEDGQCLAYTFKEGGATCVAAGERRFGPFDAPIPGTGRYYSPLVFRPGSHDIAYTAKRGECYGFEINGERIGEYEAAYDPVFSANGASHAFTASREGRECVVFNGEAGEWFKDIESDVVLSPDGTQIGYCAEDQGKAFAVINQIKGPQYRIAVQIRFSPALDTFAYVVEDEGRQSRLILPEGPGPGYNDGLSDFLFSADGRHFAYVAHTREMIDDLPATPLMTAMIDHKPVGTHKQIMYSTPGALALDESGTRLAYLMYPDEEEGTAVAINGEVGPAFEGVYGDHRLGTLHFDAQGGVGFAAHKGDKVYWVTQRLD